jgi:ferritin-like metal-binding protein YciE
MKTTRSNHLEMTDEVADSALNELFIDELKDIYWAEKHLTTALPKMAKATTTDELRTAIENHLSETENHVRRLEHVFDIIGERAVTKKCEAMVGLIKEGEEIVLETEKGSNTRDAGIISAGQKIEHYEIATYGTLKTMASVLGYNEAAEILNVTLQEEKKANDMLTQIAENGINQTAKREKK